MNEFKRTIFRSSRNNVSFYTYNFSVAKDSQGLACMEVSFPTTLYSASSSIIVSTAFFTDSGLTTPFNGLSKWYKSGIYSYKISVSGIVTQISSLCSTLLPLTKYCFQGIYNEDDPIHVPPGGVVNYQDEFGDFKTRSMITNESGIVSIYSSIEPVDYYACDLVTCP